MAKKNVYIEPRPNGQFAVMKANAKRASALCDTQAQAERKAKKMFPDVKPPCVSMIWNQYPLKITLNPGLTGAYDDGNIKQWVASVSG